MDLTVSAAVVLALDDATKNMRACWAEKEGSMYI